MRVRRPNVLEFFAGGGMARAGPSGLFDCAWANDIDPMKCNAYRANFGNDELVEQDLWDVRSESIPKADLAWASFPCQDLSLAGARAGLSAKRSGTFWGFWQRIQELSQRGHRPTLLVLENVVGLLSSHGGQDFVDIIECLAEADYYVGAMVLDARRFVPQSRPRLFIVAHQGKLPAQSTTNSPNLDYHTGSLVTRVASLSDTARQRWVWWSLPDGVNRQASLVSVLDRSPPDSAWRSQEQFEKLCGIMAPRHLERLSNAVIEHDFNVGAVYRRMRIENGERVQRAEIRYDGLAGCLRTPAGGSSRQFLVVTEGGRARMRPLMPREAARLMGCAEGYVLPERELAALKVLGDGVCVPTVRWLAHNLLLPLLGVTSAQVSNIAA